MNARPHQTPRTAVCALWAPHTASLSTETLCGTREPAPPGAPRGLGAGGERGRRDRPGKGPRQRVGPGQARPRPRVAQSGQALSAGPAGPIRRSHLGGAECSPCPDRGLRSGSRQAAAAALRLLPPPQPGGWGGARGRGLNRRAPTLARAITCATGPRERHAARGSRGGTPRPQPHEGAGLRLRGRGGARSGSRTGS